MKIFIRPVRYLLAAFFLCGLFDAVHAAPLSDLRAFNGQSFALVRNTTRDAPSRIDLVLFDPITKEVNSRRPTSLACDRVHLGRERIFCLGIPKKPGQAGPADFTVTDFSLHPLFAGNVPGGITVSRARVSPDGAYAAGTMFVTGHSYGTDTFSTEAMIIELKQKKLSLPPLEYWDTRQDNARVSARDLNLWGITFHPKNPDEFYVTAAFGKKTYLAKGRIGARRIDIVKAGIECPSFSPDGTRLAFKKKIGGEWMPAVLDLASMRETVFKESRSIDDQIEWLDNHTLVYEFITPALWAPKTNLMQLDIDKPQASSRLWLKDAGSPAFARSMQNN
ncbi:MAG: PD40 domain-containing protein [Burkholderiales bacterium]|nr:PD40 domain-containing protein [Burkholderiales bacterium]